MNSPHMNINPGVNAGSKVRPPLNINSNLNFNHTIRNPIKNTNLPPLLNQHMGQGVFIPDSYNQYQNGMGTGVNFSQENPHMFYPSYNPMNPQIFNHTTNITTSQNPQNFMYTPNPSLTAPNTFHPGHQHPHYRETHPFVPYKPPKIDFPRFEGKDPRGWIA